MAINPETIKKAAEALERFTNVADVQISVYENIAIFDIWFENGHSVRVPYSFSQPPEMVILDLNYTIRLMETPGALIG